MRIKICGVTTVHDALAAEAAGADAIGVVLFSRSPRSVGLGRAREIFSHLSPFTTRVAVSSTTSLEEYELLQSLGPDAIQVSSPFPRPDNSAIRIIRAVPREGDLPGSAECDALLLDESQGSGRPFDTAFASDLAAHTTLPLIIAGGLTPRNVADVIASMRPYGVDVASGVESALGVKDPVRMHEFVAACRATGY